MAASGSSQSAAERREAQREALRKQRQAELRRQRTVRTIVIAAITVVALVLVAGAGFLVYRAAQPEGPVAVPKGMSTDQPYLTLGAPEDSGAPVVEVHLDFMCPFCGEFEQANGVDLAQFVDDESITLNLVLRNFLDTNSRSGDFSTRSANAMVCVYEDNPDNTLAFQKLMFDNQPTEGSAGLDDDEIFDLAQQAGASDEVRSCMRGSTYDRWVDEVSDPYGKEVDNSTPFVSIDGESWGGNNMMYEPGALKATLTERLSGDASDSGGASDAGGASDGGA
ncbi:thioredoxin domain-containing protein [Brachybacterium sp. UMB0905]|uniref:DsbA family protein n=1 Tax=Brachybacterium sp. UMB0905 TaxID=2069310 RepID=UPI000C7F9FB7|nr:thioredoxin domain-containing protein [Brachybacterium sp. UMB0905]PMC75627.1 hypothetical protein CJ197_07780 [Brachybacterium sp. UMB0905]